MMKSSRDDRIAIAAGTASVLCGCGMLLLLGAPPRMPMMNFAALLVGLVLARILRLAGPAPRLGDLALVAAGLTMPATALLGPDADGVARWLVIAGITIQPGLIVVPLIAIGLAERPNALRLAAAALAALGTALQPDLGSAAMLAAGIAGAAIGTSSVAVSAALLLAIAGAGFAFFGGAALPPVPFVENVLPTAFSALGTSLIAGLGVLLMFVPPLVARSMPKGVRAAFASVWAAGLLAALLGPYPTPVIGFGGSAVLGYLLSLSRITRSTSASKRVRNCDPNEECAANDIASLRLA